MVRAVVLVMVYIDPTTLTGTDASEVHTAVNSNDWNDATNPNVASNQWDHQANTIQKSDPFNADFIVPKSLGGSSLGPFSGCPAFKSRIKTVVERRRI